MAISKVHVGWVPQQVYTGKSFKTAYEIAVGGLPTKIVVTKPPNKIDYVDGETIDLTGIIVNAYYDDDSPFTVVPVKELTLSDSVADKSKAHLEGAVSDLDTSPYIQPITTYSEINIFGEWRGNTDQYCDTKIVPASNEKLIYLGRQDGWRYVCAISKSQYPSSTITVKSSAGHSFTESPRQHFSGDNYSYFNYDGKSGTIREVWFGVGGDADVPLLYDNDDLFVTNGAAAAWTALYGSLIKSGQTLTLQWHRPIDNQVLETTFEINVSQSSES